MSQLYSAFLRMIGFHGVQVIHYSGRKPLFKSNGLAFTQEEKGMKGNA